MGQNPPVTLGRQEVMGIKSLGPVTTWQSPQTGKDGHNVFSQHLFLKL